VQFEIVRDEGSLVSLAADWRRLHAASTWVNPFTTLPWVRSCFEEHRAAAELQVIIALAESRLVGIAPLMITARDGRETIKFIGDTRGDYNGFLAENSDIERALFDFTVATRGRQPLLLCNLIAETSDLPRVIPARHINDAFAFRVSKGVTPSWITAAARRYRAWCRSGGDVTCSRGEAAANQVRAIAAVEAHSWKAKAAILRFATAEQQNFLRRVLSGCTELELWLASRGDALLAYSVSFRMAGRVCFYQGAFDESAKRYSLGNVLDYAAMKNEWEAGTLLEYDFMSGREAYKAARTNLIRPMYRVAID